jgi:hypothetical protein
MKTISLVFAALAMLSAAANAATVRCGSTWEICAQRGRGPDKPHPTNIRDNVRRGLLPVEKQAPPR